MRQRILLLCGILAPLVYVATVVLGGLITPCYSQKSQAVSELTQSGAQNKFLLDPLFALYNLLTAAFGVGLFMAVRARPSTEGRVIGSVGALALVVEAVVGLVTIFFPQDPRGAVPTLTGSTHIVLASLSSLATIATILLMGLWLRRISQVRRYSMYSFISVVIILISGGLAAWGIASDNPFGGIFERITIGAFLQWMFVMGLKLYSSTEEALALRSG